MLRSVLASLLGLAAAMPAGAQTRLPLSRMLCADAIELVKREGDVVLPIGRGTPQRFVRDRSFCAFGEVAELRFVPARDNPECPVGYGCREPGFEEWDWR
ncbi:MULTISPECIES: hypothetical protein [Methylobacterium]|uniref:Uncharacterized protein n=1 Tax=Methylobacterium jeotgali TaxID=381630 RepID=A0ABQ4T0C6_9HYPH|nr:MULTISPECIES: hypothetical protein [Methylobacterium]PIU04492.1 MAG: hypothetical protein COT56_19800 [Methylobacterium sp. CG09_land_8_20_14_0_10_71_15]PIU16550.1 MAG: hypothetical protein COT28_00050 [Methylobacterium sp. CG08_land_8_20_14_0_20_71_15]GBU19736.1 hypothetical protein AwMethylo_39510 [Methylobacterium sp.]GJE08867.1 hypothetical protein AOPFMNJM_4213 [Methylobacterium jeotgali]